ncbi:hypothetical protein SBY92_000478 [Candida maltosa Xu316]|uniref:Uncharacterized protein n=1 Tax=Candida maltosa (strain Xu316) TaxID=1245528 RepID=M3JAG6_CANMX|nr:hypothetical protein G210_0228 [Candida maltosa Xu316]
MQTSQQPRGVVPKHTLADLEQLVETQNISFPETIHLPENVKESNFAEVYNSYIHLRLQEYMSDLTSRLMNVYTNQEASFIEQNKFVNWLADQEQHFRNIDTWIPEDVYRSMIAKSHQGKLVFPNSKIKRSVMEFVDGSYRDNYVKYWADFMENYEQENTFWDVIQSFKDRLETRFEKKLHSNDFSICLYTLALNLWIDEFKRNCL